MSSTAPRRHQARHPHHGVIKTVGLSSRTKLLRSVASRIKAHENSCKISVPAEVRPYRILSTRLVFHTAQQSDASPKQHLSMADPGSCPPGGSCNETGIPLRPIASCSVPRQRPQQDAPPDGGGAAGPGLRANTRHVPALQQQCRDQSQLRGQQPDAPQRPAPVLAVSAFVSFGKTTHRAHSLVQSTWWRRKTVDWEECGKNGLWAFVTKC